MLYPIGARHDKKPWTGCPTPKRSSPRRPWRHLWRKPSYTASRRGSNGQVRLAYRLQKNTKISLDNDHETVTISRRFIDSERSLLQDLLYSGPNSKERRLCDTSRMARRDLTTCSLWPERVPRFHQKEDEFALKRSTWV